MTVRVRAAFAVAAASLFAPACRRTPSTSSATSDAGIVARGVPCGALECMQYDTPREAFLQALALANAPLVLGVGEAHAPNGATVPSAAKRFTDDLLPAIADHTSDLIVELMMPPTGCADAVAQVRREQEPVTSRHAGTDADEYVAMGSKARQLGVVPDMLRPTCADMDAIEHASATQSATDMIDVSLTTIARLSGSQAARLADRDALSDADSGKLVVVYGGALHNDLAPPPESARWSYAPDLAAHVGGRFAAIDLVVPEFIGLDATWAKLPWWPHYDEGRLGRKTTLFRIGPQSFVLVFPVGAPPP
jgi:hypothetical protein